METNTQEMTIDEFCLKFDIQKVDLAKAFGITKQTLNGQAKGENPSIISFSLGSDTIKLMKPAKIMKSGRIHGFDNVEVELHEPEKEEKESPAETPAPVVEKELTWKERKAAGLIQ